MLNFHKQQQQLQMLQNSIAKVTQAFGIKLKVLKLFHAATEAPYKNLHHFIPEQLIHHQVIRTIFWEPFRLREMGMFLTYVNPHA